MKQDLRHRFRVHLASARPVTTHAERSFSGEATVEKYARAESAPSYQTPIRDMQRCSATEITDKSSSEYELADLRCSLLITGCMYGTQVLGACAARHVMAAWEHGLSADRSRGASCGGSYTQRGHPAVGEVLELAGYVGGLRGRLRRRHLVGLRQPSWQPMRVGTGAVLAEAEAGGNAVHEVGK